MKTSVLLIALILLFDTASAQPGSKSFSGVTLKVMSYNIHHANPPSKPGLIDVDAIVRVIRDQGPDLVALQEVDVKTKRSGTVDQAAEIAGKLGMRFFFGKAINHDGGEYGVAILSKYPISGTTVHRLPIDSATRGEPRVMATALIALPDGKRVRFAVTHLDAQGNPLNRRLQIAEINRLAAAEKLPLILAGDFNAEPESDVLQALAKQFNPTCHGCAPTFPVVTPEKTIDYIALSRSSGFAVKRHEVIPEHYASDHLPIVAELVLP